MFNRALNLSGFGVSFFLFGPRQVGKTFLIEHTLSPDIFIDLLDQQAFLKYSHDASLLSQEITMLKKEAGLVVIDEIQRTPELLNQVQLVMNRLPGFRFILTGSSARKLKRAGVNLLGGRAIILHLHPLTSSEMGESFSLGDVLRFGSLPNIVLADGPQTKIRLLRGYVETYLKEEIQQEALTRNIPAFAKFLELAAHENGNIINFQRLAREIGVDSKTTKEYFHILEDTLLGFLLPPYSRSHRRRLIAHPKFYFFDCGVTASLRKENDQPLVPGTPPYGRAFEHFVALEMFRILDYHEKQVKLSFFRTSNGAEVDFILEIDRQVWAIEIKSGATPGLTDIRGLRSFISDHKYDRAICVCQAARPYIDGAIEFLPWQEFLKQL